MKKEERIITGIIDNNDYSIAFTIHDFKLILFRTDSLMDEIHIMVDEAGYIWGITSDEREIAIFIGDSFYMRKNCSFSIWNYIISKYKVGQSSINSISGIRFQNGAVNMVFPCTAFNEDREIEDELRKDKKGNYLVYKVENDNRDFFITDGNNQKTKWRFRSYIVHSNSWARDSEACLEIVFPQIRGIGDFYKYYGYASNLISFLSFRKSVYFEKVSLLRAGQEEYLEEIAECFIKLPDIDNSRAFQNTISVYLLSDNEFESILNNIIFIKKDKMFLPLSILPDDEKDLLTGITSERIQIICASLEAEINLARISVAKDETLISLINPIKEMIKNHQSGETPLPEKTYSLIYSSISHWGDALADRIQVAWDMHYKELFPLFKYYNINEDMVDINGFVKKRNKITHDGFNEISKKEYSTAFMMIGLIYCMTLKRMGMDSEKIKDIMSKRVIG